MLIVRGGAFRCRNAVTLGLHRMHLRLNWKFWIVSSTNIFTECHKIYIKVLIDKSWDPKLHLSMLLLKRAALSFLLNKKYNFKAMRNPSIPRWGCSEEKYMYSFEKLPAWNSVIQTVRSNGIYIYVNWADKVYFLERGQFSENLHLLTSAETIVVIDKILQIMTFIFNEYHILVLSVIVTKWKYLALVCWYKMGPFLIQLQLYFLSGIVLSLTGQLTAMQWEACKDILFRVLLPSRQYLSLTLSLRIWFSLKLIQNKSHSLTKAR